MATNNKYARHLGFETTKVGINDAIKNTFKKVFDVDININHYLSVISGEGHEEDKIDSVYSSSLQSLLIFDKVSEERPIFFILGDNVYKFTEVYFEYKNKVIGYPSSVDVALSNKDGDVLFIESKLFEIVRDSINKDMVIEDGDSENKYRVIRPSYFSDDKNGYLHKLKLSKEDLLSIGIVAPEWYGGPVADSEIRSVKPIKNNEHTYPYGVKQFLSHAIGVLNYRKPNGACSRKLKDKTGSVHFITLINDLPGFTDDNAQEKINGFKNHCSQIVELLNTKDLRVGKQSLQLHEVLTYQDLFRLKENAEYFSKIEKIVRIYKLDE